MSTTTKSADSILSFRDIPPHQARRPSPPSGPTRLLYKPSYDLQFDLEMAQRRGDQKEGLESAQPALSYGDDDPAKIEEEANPAGLEFGSKFLESENVFDDETLNSLLLPPSPEYFPGLERELRPEAIYLYNRSVGLLKTEQIISHVLQTVKNTREPRFEHLEWIDDFSCVLAFADKQAAIEAFGSLLLKPDEVEGENGVAEAIDFLSFSTSTPPSRDVLTAAADFVFALRPSKPLGSSLFATSQPNPLLHPDRPEKLVPFIRFATSYDVKRRNAKDHSLFYSLHGARAGRDGVQADRAKSPLSQSSKRRRVSGQSSSGLADLPGRWPRDDQSESHPRQISRLPSSGHRGGRNGRSQATTAADLDDELDRFMSRGGAKKADSDGKDGDASEDLMDDRPLKRHERDLDSEPSEHFNEEDLFPRSRLGVGGGNLDKSLTELFADSTDGGEKVHRHRSPSEDGLRTWIVRSDQQINNDDELGEDEELVDEYVEMIDEETGQKIRRLIQSRRRKPRLLRT